jgi:hypothetical protein
MAMKTHQNNIGDEAIISSANTMKGSHYTNAEMLRLEIDLALPVIAAVTPVVVTLPNGQNLSRQLVITAHAEQPEKARRDLLQSIQPDKHSRTMFINPDDALQELVTAGATILRRSLERLLRVTTDQPGKMIDIVCNADAEWQHQKDYGRPHTYLDALLGALFLAGLQADVETFPSDLGNFVLGWVALEHRLTEDPADEPSARALVDAFALPANRCGHQPYADEESLRLLAALNAKAFVQRGLIDAVGHLSDAVEIVAKKLSDSEEAHHAY